MIESEALSTTFSEDHPDEMAKQGNLRASPTTSFEDHLDEMAKQEK